MASSQYADLGTGFNGQTQQNLTFSSQEVYVLGWQQLSINTDYFSHKAEVYWNDIIVATLEPNTTTITQEYAFVQSEVGDNNVRFVEIGDQSGSYGSRGIYLDNICLQTSIEGACGFTGTVPSSLTNTTTNTTTNNIPDETT